MALSGMAKISKEIYEKRKELNKLEAKASSTENNDTYKPGYDVRDFKNISFKDYTRMKEQANKPSQGFIGNIFGQGQRLKDDVKYLEDNNMINDKLEVAPVAGVEGITIVDDGFGGTMAIKDDQVPRVGVNPSFSGGQTASPVARKQVVTQEVPPVFLPEGLTPKDKSTFGFHKRDGQNFLTQNENDPYWDDRIKGTGDGFTHAELKKKPQQEIDFEAFKAFFN